MVYCAVTIKQYLKNLPHYSPPRRGAESPRRGGSQKHPPIACRKENGRGKHFSTKTVLSIFFLAVSRKQYLTVIIRVHLTPPFKEREGVGWKIGE